MTASVKVSGTIKTINTIYVKQSGVWKPAAGYAKNGSGVWKPFLISERVVVAPTSASLANVEDLFEAQAVGAWTSSIKKKLIVNSLRGPLVVNSIPGGQLTIDIVGGVLAGLGGVSNGANGGHALSVTVATGIIVKNEGIIRGGGGAGGKGGNGGAGSYIVRDPTSGDYYEGIEFFPILTYGYYTGPGHGYVWNNSTLSESAGLTVGSFVVSSGGYNYYVGSYKGEVEGYSVYGVYRSQTIITAGGIGGNGGRGEGIDGSNHVGTLGGTGGTNAGNGGAGSSGGFAGNSGNTGSNGTSGNAGAGSAGMVGGASGKAIMGYNRIIYSGGGILGGGTSSS